MAAGAFRFETPWITAMDIEEVLNTLRQIDLTAFLAMTSELDDDLKDRRQVLDWVFINRPRMFECLENIARVFHSANFLAVEQTQAYMTGYMHTKDLEIENKWLRYQNAESTPSEEAAQEKKSPQKREREEKKKGAKKTPVPEPRPPRSSAVAQDAPVDVGQPETWFTKFEPWTSNFPLNEYVHFARKGYKRLELAAVRPRDQWQTVFHTSGPWAAEQLVELLEQQGFYAIPLKLKRGGADMEVLAYKVLSTAPVDRFISKVD